MTDPSSMIPNGCNYVTDNIFFTCHHYCVAQEGIGLLQNVDIKPLGYAAIIIWIVLVGAIATYLYVKYISSTP